MLVIMVVYELDEMSVLYLLLEVPFFHLVNSQHYHNDLKGNLKDDNNIVKV